MLQLKDHVHTRVVHVVENVESGLADLAEALLGDLLHQHRVVPLRRHGRVRQTQECPEPVHREVALQVQSVVGTLSEVSERSVRVSDLPAAALPADGDDLLEVPGGDRLQDAAHRHDLGVLGTVAALKQDNIGNIPKALGMN